MPGETVSAMLLSVIKDQGNNYITINDITDYAGQTVVPANICRMLFYSKDNFTLDFNVDQGNPPNYTWTEPIVNSNTYSIAAFAYYKWDHTLDIDFIQGQFAFDNGAFYLLLNDVTINSLTGVAPSLDAINWARFAPGLVLTYKAIPYAPLTVKNCYDIMMMANAILWYGINQIQINGPLFTLQKVACHQWQLIKNNSLVIQSISLIDYDRITILHTYAIGLQAGNIASIDLDTDGKGDGVYIVRISYLKVGNAAQGIIDLPLSDLCKAYECYMNLFDYKLCNCDDPCDNCNEKDAKRHHDAEMLMNMIMFIERMIFMDKYINTGIYSITDSRAIFLNNLGQCLDKLRIVTERCGICGEHETNKVNC